MNRLRQTWLETCERMGVKPRQFAMLVGVLVVSVSALGFRMMASSSRAPKSEPVASAPAASATAEQIRAVSLPQPVAAPAPVVEVSLDQDCARDPFRAWDVPVAVPAQVAVQTRVATGQPEPGTLPGTVLRAVVKGELAVFGDQTVRKGQSVMVGDEGHARILEIGDRTVTVDFDGRMLEVALGAAEKPGKPAGGFR